MSMGLSKSLAPHTGKVFTALDIQEFIKERLLESKE